MGAVVGSTVDAVLGASAETAPVPTARTAPAACGEAACGEAACGEAARAAPVSSTASCVEEGKLPVEAARPVEADGKPPDWGRAKAAGENAVASAAPSAAASSPTRLAGRSATFSARPPLPSSCTPYRPVLGSKETATPARPLSSGRAERPCSTTRRRSSGACVASVASLMSSTSGVEPKQWCACLRAMPSAASPSLFTRPVAVAVHTPRARAGIQKELCNARGIRLARPHERRVATGVGAVGRGTVLQQCRHNLVRSRLCTRLACNRHRRRTDASRLHLMREAISMHSERSSGRHSGKHSDEMTSST